LTSADDADWRRFIEARKGISDFRAGLLIGDGCLRVVDAWWMEGDIYFSRQGAEAPRKEKDRFTTKF